MGPVDGSGGAGTVTERASRRRRWRIVIGVGLVLVLAVVVLWSTVFRLYVNEGESMLPSLDSGDRLIVNRLATADVGDVVVVRVATQQGRQVVKRIVALGGDTIAYVGCQVVRNDEPVDEPYDTIDEPCVGEFDRTTVPDDEVFVMGDNRPGSSDSRSFGSIPTGDVVGVVAATP
jgi:signal peptidase I